MSQRRCPECGSTLQTDRDGEWECDQCCAESYVRWPLRQEPSWEQLEDEHEDAIAVSEAVHGLLD